MSDSSCEFADFIARFHAHMSADPNRRVFLGFSDDVDRLPDVSEVQSAAEVAEARALLAMLDGIDTATLGFDARFDLDLARLQLEREIHDRTYTFNGRTMAAQLPLGSDGIGGGIFGLFINDPRPAEQRLQDITGRIEDVPRFLDAMLARLDTPVARWVDVDADQIVELPELFATVHAWALEEQWPHTSRLEAAIERANPAIRDYVKGLRALPTTTQLHVGTETARKIVALRGIEASLEELHALATRFLAETRQEIERLRTLLVARHGLALDTSVRDLQKWLNTKFRSVVDGSPDDVLVAYEAARTRIRAFVDARELFPIPEAQDMRILKTPGFLTASIPAGAMVPPASFRDGVRTSLVYLTLSEELMDEHTQLGVPLMMVHEGIPGHHLQLATASLHDSIVRRHFHGADLAEGWTTMLEDYMLDMGLMGELTDEARFATKLDLSRLGARVAIDLFFMTGDRTFLDVGVDCDVSSEDPFEAAGTLLEAITGFTPGRVQAELNWYSMERGYPLSYLYGNATVWSLKGDLRSFDDPIERDRVFHRTFLEAGNMPVAWLRRIFEAQDLLATL